MAAPYSNLALVDYSDSSEENSDIEFKTDRKLAAKRKKKSYSNDTLQGHILKRSKKAGDRIPLPVPEDILNLFPKSDDKVQENYEDHQGKIRSFPHMRGNWATHVFIPYTPDPHVLKLITSLQKCLHPDVAFNVMEEFHISVSRTVVIALHCIEPLIDSLREQVYAITRFPVKFQELGIYTNDEKTRSFIGLKVNAGDTNLRHVTQQVDIVMQDFSLPIYYKHPSFHVSLCWALGDVTSKITDHMPKLQKKMEECFMEDSDVLSMMATEIQCKTGNKLFSFSLVDR